MNQLVSFFQSFWSFLGTESSQLTLIMTFLGIVLALLNLMKLVSDSHERTRPYIALEPRPGVHLTHGAIDLVISNHGQSAAHNIRIRPLHRLSPGNCDSRNKEDKDVILCTLSKFFEEEFHLAPQARFRVIWRMAEKEHVAGMEALVNLEVSYTWKRSGLFKRDFHFKEITPVNTRFEVAYPVPNVGAERTSGPDIRKSLANINHALRALSKHIANRY